MIKYPTAVRWDTFSLSQEISQSQISLIFWFVSLVVLCHQNFVSLSPQHCFLCDDADVGGQISLEPLTLSPPSPSVSVPPPLSLLPLQLCLLSVFVHWDWSDGILQEESPNGALAFIISHL